MRNRAGFVVLSVVCLGRLPAAAPADLVDVVPAQAVALVEVDARPDGPALRHVYGGRNAHTLELFKAWLKAGAQQGLVELSQDLDVEKDILRWLDGRGAAVVLRKDKKSALVPYFVARVKNELLAQHSLAVMGRAAEKKGWVKFFQKSGAKGPLFHLVLTKARLHEKQKKNPEDEQAAPRKRKKPVPDICFGVRGGLLVVAETMDALENWFALAAEGKPFGATAAAARLRTWPDAVMKFYVRTAMFQPRDLSKLPLPVPLPGGGIEPPEAAEPDGEPPADPPDRGDDVPGPLDLVDSILGALTYTKAGVRYDFAAAFTDDLPDGVRETLGKWERARAPGPELATVVPAKTVAAVQVAAPGDLLAAFGVDLTTPEGWATFFGAPREEETEPPSPPASLRPLLAGEVLVCLPRLQRLTPPQEADEAFNPLNFLPATLVVRMKDAHTATTAFSGLRDWLTRNSPLRFTRLASGNVWAALLKESEHPTPLAFATAAGPYLVVSRSVSEITGARERIAGSGGSLSDDSDYQEVVRALGEGAPVQFYLNLTEFLAQGGEIGLAVVHRPNRYLRRALELTLAGMRGLGFSCRATGRSLHARMFMGVDYDRISDAQTLQLLAIVAAQAAPIILGRAKERAEETAAGDEGDELGDLEDLNNHGDCAENLGAVADAVLAYARKQRRYPDANQWVQQVKPYLKSVACLHCPADAADHPCSYGFNEHLSRLPVAKVPHPDKTILLFDCASAGPNPSGGPNAVAFRHDGEAYLAYCDRHLEIVDHAPRKGWKPAGAQRHRERGERK